MFTDGRTYGRTEARHIVIPRPELMFVTTEVSRYSEKKA